MSTKNFNKDGEIINNILNDPIKPCSYSPLTGFYRNGYCHTGSNDRGTHTVCAVMDKKFLEYTKAKGNDLSSVVKAGERWCLCEFRWNQAYLDGTAPKVIFESTNVKTRKEIVENIYMNEKQSN